MKPALHKILAVGTLAGGSLVFLRWIPDDAYISFRYARNFSDGLGLVFNPGERVEGYSNFLWTLVLGLLARAGADIVFAATVLSAAAALGTAWVSLRLFDDIAGESGVFRAVARWPLVAGGLILVVSLPMVYWATSGLETFAAAFFLILGATLHVEAEHGRRPSLHSGSILSFLAVALLRPEGVMFLVLNACALYLRYRRRWPRRVAAALIAAAAVVVALLIARWSYYHSIVPNTYWAKPSTMWGYTLPLRNGLRYLVRYSLVSALVPLLPLVVVALVKRPGYTVRYLGFLLTAQLSFIVWVGGDVLRFDRFMVAAHPLLVSLVLAGALRIDIRRRRWVAAALSLAVAASLAVTGARIHRAHAKYCAHDFMQSRFDRMLGEALDEMLPPGATIAFNEMGAVPYYSHRVTYDIIGLTDATVAAVIFDSYRRYHTAATDECRRTISDYILSRDPTCIILPSRGAIDPRTYAGAPELFHPIWYGIYTHPAFRAGYRAAFTVEHHPSKLLHVFVLHDVPLDYAPLARLRGPDCLRVTVHE
jgi:hypothetical protein